MAVVIPQVLMNEETELREKDHRRADQECRKSKLQDHEAFLQIIPAAEADPAIQGLYGIKSRKHECRIEARQQTRQEEQGDVPAHQLYIEQIGQAQFLVGQLV